jgi:hypothetical protein
MLFDQTFRKQLFEGRLGYETVAVFAPVRDFPAKSLLRIAAWGVNYDSQISPTIVFMKRQGSVERFEGQTEPGFE